MWEANHDTEVSWAHRALFLGVHWDSVMDVIFIFGHGYAAPHRTSFRIMQRSVCLNKAVSTHSPGPGGGHKSGFPYGSLLCPQADPFQKLGHIHTKSVLSSSRTQKNTAGRPVLNKSDYGYCSSAPDTQKKKKKIIYKFHQPLKTMQFT